MAQRRPAVIIGGGIKRLPAGDVMPGAPGLDITTTTATLNAANIGYFNRCSNASAQLLTVANDASTTWEDDAQLEGAQLGAGKVSFVAQSPAVIRVGPSFVASTLEQYSPWGLKRLGANEWLLFGVLESA